MTHSLSLSHFNRIRLFVTPWTVAHQAPLSMAILQARVLDWVAVPSSRGSSRARDRTQVSYTYLHWQVGSLPLAHLGSPKTLQGLLLGLLLVHTSLLMYSAQGKLMSPLSSGNSQGSKILSLRTRFFLLSQTCPIQGIARTSQCQCLTVHLLNHFPQGKQREF